MMIGFEGWMAKVRNPIETRRNPSLTWPTCQGLVAGGKVQFIHRDQGINDGTNFPRKKRGMGRNLFIQFNL
jgi:hypothetical protein